VSESTRAERELHDLLGELDTLIKSTELGAVLDTRGVNVSLTLVIVEGLRAYLAGKKVEAAEELFTAAEEIRTRHESHRSALS
jgi:hypothetical protein